jgi:GNAT superfamily N-acetyltransferase
MSRVMPFSQASVALAESLIDDPFYWAITDDFGPDASARKQALQPYFKYSLQEAHRTGRCAIAPDPSLGAAAWLLPRNSEVHHAESEAKSQYLASILGPRGNQNYHRMVDMAPLAEQVVPPTAWYLSIVGILPAAQGRGIGAALLSETLAEASTAKVPCYLETFTPRNLPFYNRLGFRRAAEYVEPVTGSWYVVMLRDGD